jgi:hypothetical protein
MGNGIPFTVRERWLLRICGATFALSGVTWIVASLLNGETVGFWFGGGCTAYGVAVALWMPRGLKRR